MAFDEGLAERVRELISARADVSEKKMFGSLAFLIAGNMAVGVRGEELIVRLGEADAGKALAEEGVQEFPPNRSPMKGWVLVSLDPDDEGALAEWVEAGADYAASLPPK